MALANALINSNYKYSSPEKNHGLQIDEDTYQSVTLKKRGIFPRLHNIYSDDLSLLLYILIFLLLIYIIYKILKLQWKKPPLFLFFSY